MALFVRQCILQILLKPVSKPVASPDISIGGMKDHYLWGLMLLITVFHGPGKLSIDELLRRRLRG